MFYIYNGFLVGSIRLGLKKISNLCLFILIFWLFTLNNLIGLYYQLTISFLFVPLFHFPSFSVFFWMKWLIFLLHFLFSPGLLALTLYFVVWGLTVYIFNLLQSTLNTHTQYSITTLQSHTSISPLFTLLLLLSCISHVLQTLYVLLFVQIVNYI